MAGYIRNPQSQHIAAKGKQKVPQSGLEVAAAILTLLETSSSIIEQIHDVFKSQKEHACPLRNYYDHEARRQPGNIAQPSHSKPDDLSIADISPQLATMENLAQRLVGHITRSRLDLLVVIQAAVANIQHSSGQDMVAHAEVVHQIDSHIQQVLGEGRGLRIAALVDDHSISGRKEAGGAERATESTDAYEKKERVIENNLAQMQALQINGPVGEDRWQSMGRLVIRENRASAFSTQVNYPVSEGIVYALVLDRVVKYVCILALLYMPFSWLFQMQR
ncbi:hypothetical protein ASPACDRAFT_41356 [Aspergillus aculeatus ATCC 16872]|uniref:Uncharacterized protein n=1 Tax=Aspergillus aculeatus (strain ATCC 16872 / CBS 172.66 / WB 5094) TaxID=690307 RepID=A0A1L9X2K1_ASPA1|nr:uncharacterized protein ASPACDRAFT_41356 [Aspergillus aculeatus ATCC 16872]OJK02529.1 hypothetical protein ASPACDRAFT_41356 [Aspergillus aculeatus ATCC 16872]